MKSLQNFFGILFFFFSFSTLAAASPVAMLQGTSNQLIAALQSNQAALKSNPRIVDRLVRQIILPHVAIDTMARSVLGRNVWTQASAAQQNRFKQEFTSLLIRTYAAAFSNYTDETVKFMPMRGGAAGRTVQVNSVIVRSRGNSIPVNYRLVQQGGTWMVYDFSVEGVSMLESFRSQFAQQLSQGNLDQLIQTMSRHNRK